MLRQGHGGRPFFGTLESLRGIAALLVVLSHMTVIGRGPLSGLFVQNGVLMVQFFFVLSGFVISYNYYERLKDKAGFLKFIFLRFFRLYPVHLTFLLVWLGFETARYFYVHYTGVQTPVTVPFRENNLQALIENLFMVQALGFSNHGASFNGPSWSISVEFYTYMVFAVLTRGLSRKAFLVAALVIPIVALVGLTEFASRIGNFGSSLSCLTGFFLGVWVYFLYRKWAINTNWLAVLGVIAFFGFLATSLNGNLIYILSAILIFTVVSSNNWLTKALLWTPFVWLGRISYSLYMSHMAVIWASGMIIAKVSGANLSASAQARFAMLSDRVALTCYVVILAIVLCVAKTVYRLVEAPAREWSRRRIAAIQSRTSLFDQVHEAANN